MGAILDLLDCREGKKEKWYTVLSVFGKSWEAIKSGLDNNYYRKLTSLTGGWRRSTCHFCNASFIGATFHTLLNIALPEVYVRVLKAS